MPMRCGMIVYGKMMRQHPKIINSKHLIQFYRLFVSIFTDMFKEEKIKHGEN